MYFTNLNQINFHQARALSAILAEWAANCSTYPIEAMGYSHYFGGPCSFVLLNNGIRIVSGQGEEPTYIVEDLEGLEYEYGEFNQALNQLNKLNEQV